MSDYLPYNIWVFLFRRGQKYNIKQNGLFQDNQSPIKMEKNGKKFCTGNSKHIDICYFFSKDRVKSNKISIAYCSIEHILAGFALKPYKETCSLKILT